MAWWVLMLSAPPAVASCPVCEAAIQHYDTSDGLSHNAVVAIAQDTDGFIWLGTRDGLDRLDGRTVRRFDRIAGHDLRAEQRLTLAPGPDGALWIGLQANVLLRAANADVSAFGLPALATRSAPTATHLLADADGVWVGLDDGLLRIDLARGDVHRVASLDGEPVRALRRQGDELLVLSGSRRCQLSWIDPVVRSARSRRPAYCAASQLTQPTAPTLDNDAESRGRPAELPAAPPTGDDDLPIVLPWRGGTLLAGVPGAFWRDADGSTWPLGQRSGLGSEVLAAAVDRDQALWIGTYAGAYRIDPDQPAFNGIDGGPLDRALAERAVSDITHFDGHWWFGTFDQGLLSWSPAAAEPRLWPGDAADMSQPGRHACGDYLWDLQPGLGRLLLNGRCSLPSAVGGAAASLTDLALDARDSLVDRSGRWWIVNADGLFELTGDQATLRVPGGFETLAVTAAGELWLASLFGPQREPAPFLLGYRSATAAVRRLALPRGARVYDIHADGNRLWLASGRGLLRVDTDSGMLATFEPAQGDAGRVFYSVRPDSTGALWVGSNRGLLRFDPDAKEGQWFRHYDARDGLGITEFNRRSHAADGDGRLLFGGIGGAVRFDPQRARSVPPAPRPWVSHALLSNRSGERRVELRPGDALTLSAQDQSVVLEFAAPTFRRAGHLQFRYRMQGVDADWVAAGAARSARYPRLDPGDYRFALQAGSAADGWRDDDAPLRLRFLPAWHESLWFRLPALLGMLLGAWLLYRWRLARLLEVERLRLRIAADLHDELGSELAAIGMAAAMLGERDVLGAGERRRLAGVAESAQKLAEAMRDIVWYVNPEKDSVAALGERLQTLARRLFGDDRVEVQNGWRGDDLALSMAVRRELHLIGREALANAHRHAGASRVLLRLVRDPDAIALEVHDDGCGFDPAAPASGNGLGNLRRRAAAIGATLRIDSAPGRGTRIALRLTHPRRGRGWRRPLG